MASPLANTCHFRRLSLFKLSEYVHLRQDECHRVTAAHRFAYQELILAGRPARRCTRLGHVIRFLDIRRMQPHCRNQLAACLTLPSEDLCYGEQGLWQQTLDATARNTGGFKHSLHTDASKTLAALCVCADAKTKTSLCFITETTSLLLTATDTLSLPQTCGVRRSLSGIMESSAWKTLREGL